jgi:hypothetical protein
MQHMIKGLVCPLRAKLAPYGQVLASETVKQAQSSLRFAQIVQTKQIAALGALLWLVAQRSPKAVALDSPRLC